MTIYEADVPGVGKKFEVELDGDRRLIVLIHHDGKREVYLRPGENEDGEKLFSLSGRLARQVGSILEGAYFQPVDTEDVQVPLGEALIEWVNVRPPSSLVGRTLEEASIRQRTGASVIAIQRGDETIPNPDPDDTIQSGDILISIGTRNELAALSDLVAGGTDDGTDDGTGDVSDDGTDDRADGS